MHRPIIAAAFALVLTGADGGFQHALAQAPAAAQDSAILAPRLIALEGVQNFRDIGGYRTVDGRHVKWGRIYRSAELSHLSQADLTTLARLNIRAVHDLRSVSERTAEPTAWTGAGAPPVIARDYVLDLSSMAALHLEPPTVDAAHDAFVKLYLSFLDTQRPQETALFDELLNNDGATLYHCTAGKDRTGIATAMILAALGVPRDSILYDYELSNRYFSGGIAARGTTPNQAQATSGRLPPDIAAVFMTVDARYLRAVFQQIDQDYGSIDVYLDQRLGVDAADLSRLRTLYTE